MKTLRAYVGITGLSGTGKDTVGDFLASLAVDHKLSVHRYKLSDEIREELIQRGHIGELDSRATLIEIGNELRRVHGEGVLAERVVDRDASRCLEAACDAILVIISGIRTPGEVQAFRAHWNGLFLLVSVEASIAVRLSRLGLRSQYREDVCLPAEVERADRAIGILACGQIADHHIGNDGSVEELQDLVKRFFEGRIAVLLGHEPISPFCGYE